MPIKLKRTSVFSEQEEQGQTVFLDDDCLLTLRHLDRIVCDANLGRSQPDSPFHEIEAWFSDGQYWSDAYNTRWNLAATLTYMATHPDADDFDWRLADSLDYRDNWSEWNEEKKSAVAEAALHLWHWLLEQPPGEPIGPDTSFGWNDTFAKRMLSFAKSLDLLDRRFFEELFQANPTSDKFFNECLFVLEYWDKINDPNDPWVQYLPSQAEIRRYLQQGFFEFPEHEEISSSAEQYIAWKSGGFELIDD